MPYYMEHSGLTEVEKSLKEIGDKASAIASLGLYEGAGVMADEVKNQVDTIRTEKFHYAVFPPRTSRLPTPEEVDVIREGCGISKFRKNASGADTSVGFSNAGYAMLKGKRKPIPLIANSINSGTSFMKKQPFFRKAVVNATPKAEAAIVDKIEAEINAMNK